MARNKLALAALLLISGLVALAGILASRAEPQVTQPLGLMTSLPIYWSSSADFGDIASGESSTHWVRGVLEEQYGLVLLDSLSANGGTAPNADFAKLQMLVLAQPRPLAPADYAALDEWVRGGGRVLIFADPVLTEHSELSLGDPRRPQGAALFSPLFTRWGLRQLFDESQPDGIREVGHGDTAIPVDQAGKFELLDGAAAECKLAASNIISDCEIGAGRALIVSDAAVLDREANGSVNRRALKALLRAGLGTR